MAKNRFTNLPDQGRVWKVGKDYYYAIKSPKGGGFITWKFRNKSALKSAFVGGKIKVSRRMSKNAFKGRGGINWGFTDEIKNAQHPWAQFLQNWKKEAQINPMLKSKEVIAVYAQATMEGRAPTRAEIETTKWWRTRTAEERAWVQLASGDPKTARMIRTRNRLETRDALVAAGLQGDPSGAAAHLADQFTKGGISKQQLQRRISQLTDPFEEGANKFAGRKLPEGTQIVRDKKTGKLFARYNGKNYALATEDARVMFTPTGKLRTMNIGKGAGSVSEIASKQFDELSSQAYVGDVDDMVTEWLGPKFAAGWDNRAVENWAHKLRDNENEKVALEEELKRQRQAVLPGYDENLTYDQIAQPWRSVVQDVWGQQMDENDDLFYQILKANDVEVAGKMLRQEGRARGVQKVQADAVRALTQSMGGQMTGVMGNG